MKYTVACLSGVVLLAIVTQASSQENNLEESEYPLDNIQEEFEEPQNYLQEEGEYPQDNIQEGIDDPQSYVPGEYEGPQNYIPEENEEPQNYVPEEIQDPNEINRDKRFTATFCKKLGGVTGYYCDDPVTRWVWRAINWFRGARDCNSFCQKAGKKSGACKDIKNYDTSSWCKKRLYVYLRLSPKNP